MITLEYGHVQNASNLAVPNGSIVFQLNVDAEVTASPYGQVSSGVPITFQFDSTGNLQAGAKLYSNAELNPQNSLGLGTYYLVTFYDQNGAILNQEPLAWQFISVSLSYAQLASDTFQRADANPIGGNWTPLSTTGLWTVAQLISDEVYGTVVVPVGDGIASDSFYNAVTWPNDQWAETTIGSLLNFGTVGVSLRMATDGSQNEYSFIVQGDGVHQGSWEIQAVNGGAFTVLASGFLPTTAAGDIVRGEVQGNVLRMFYNGTLLGEVTDSSISSGAAGFAIEPSSVAVTDVAISSWRGGSILQFGNATVDISQMMPYLATGS
jgi:hypothetical protein